MNQGESVDVALIGGAPLRVGIVAAEGDRFGPIIATSIPLGRRKQERGSHRVLCAPAPPGRR